MVKLIKIVSCFVFTVLSTALYAQATTPPDALGVMRSNGKIYVVVAVVITILIGVFLYLFSLDRKITRLENNSNGKP